MQVNKRDYVSEVKRFLTFSLESDFASQSSRLWEQKHGEHAWRTEAAAAQINRYQIMCQCGDLGFSLGVSFILD